MKKSKIKGLILLLIIYVIATFAGIGIYILLKPYLHPLLCVLIADVVATIVVWLTGIPLKTASVYDPYWSVQPIVIGILLMIDFSAYNLGTFLYLGALAFWAIRLTFNFCIEFTNLNYIDWRYASYKAKYPKIYQLINLFGFCMMPTLLVYATSLPVFVYIINGYDFNFLNIIGLSIMVIATFLELFADVQMKKFRRERKSRSELNRIGLWKYSRHPNYLGEISFWYGVAAVAFIGNFSSWYLPIGAILNTLLFVFISIPLAENSMKSYKDGFEEYKRETRMLLPIPRFKK